MSETDFLKLKKHDNVETNTEKFDIENYLNGNWDKIDEAFGKDRERISTLETDNTTNKSNITKNSSDITTLKSNVTDINAKIDNIQSLRGHIYGVRRKITNNTSTAWERIKDSIGLVANATKNGTTVQNDFDKLY